MKAKVIFGGIFLGIAAVGLYVKNKFFQKNTLTKEQLVDILHTMRVQYYPIMHMIAEKSQKLIQQKMQPSQIRQKLQQDEQLLKKQRESVDVKAVEKMQQATSRQFKDDVQVCKLKKLFTQEYELSFLGVFPASQIKVSRVISKEKLLQIAQQLLKSKIQRLASHNFTNLNDQERYVCLHNDQIQQNTKAQQLIVSKLKIVKGDCLDTYHFMIANYCKNDAQFNGAYEQIKQEYINKIQQMLKK